MANPTVLVLLFALAVLAINPIGYKGGRADDWQYLQAARCAAEQGFCLPQDHWWRRFSLVIPVGFAIQLLGESPLTVSLVPLLYGLGSIALFVLLLQRQFGRQAALLGGFAFAATPVIGERLLEVSIDTAELFLMLGSVFCLQSAHRGGRRWLIPAAGALFGLAVLARPTQLALLPIFAAAFWLMPNWRRHAFAFGAGLLAPVLAEALVYAAWTGDMLYPWKLSLAHTRIPSTELAKDVDLTQSPLFNVAYIDGWKNAMGVSVHWTVDGLLNLLIHPTIGLSLVIALMLLGLDHRWLRSRNANARLFLFLIGGSALFYGALVYGFAIDPKPRMFLPILAVACAGFGLLASERLRKSNKMLVVACLSLLTCKSVISSWDMLAVDRLAITAAEWSKAEPGAIAVSPITSTLLTLAPAIRALPVGQDARPKLLVIVPDNCERATEEAEFQDWTVLREHRHFRDEPSFVTAMRSARLFFQPPQMVALCLIQKPAR